MQRPLLLQEAADEPQNSLKSELASGRAGFFDCRVSVDPVFGTEVEVGVTLGNVGEAGHLQYDTI